MWLRGQNMEKPIRAHDGSVWHFRVWRDFIDNVYIQRIYFWDEARETTGCAEFSADQSLHVSKIKQRIRKLVTDSDYRNQFKRELRFPVEKHY
jgi:hypothetical protein